MGAADALIAQLRQGMPQPASASAPTDLINRGLIAGTLGAPADMGNLLANALRAGVGYIGGKTGLLKPDQLPELQDKPVLGSEWIGDKMQDAGMVSPNRNPMGEALVGMADPLSGFGGMTKAAGAAGKLSDVLRAEAAERAASRATAGQFKGAAADAAGYTHPYGLKVKTERPFQDMTSSTVPDPQSPMMPRYQVDFPSMEGGVLVPVVGDRSAAGRLLVDINGRPLSDPVRLEGGPGFMQTHGWGDDPAIWASHQSKISGLANQIRKAMQEHGADRAYLAYLPMGPESLHFNTMMSDVLQQKLRGLDLARGDVRSFDKEVQGMRPEFPGLQSPRLADYMRSDAEGRKAVMDRMNMERYQAAGFPDLTSIRKAITEPELLDTPALSGGYAFGQVDPNRLVITDPSKEHSTYLAQTGGTYKGGTEDPVPLQYMLPDWWKGRRDAGAALAGDQRSLDWAKPTQLINQDMLKNLMGYTQQPVPRP